MAERRPIDLAGQSYWDGIWSHSNIPSPIDPRRNDLDNFANQALHAFLADALGQMPTHGKSLIEVGCARSRWLPYFAAEFGFSVSGLDYSSIGCEQAREILTRAGLHDARIYEGDLFNPPPVLIGSRDVVVSFGLVEHFADTAACVAALARLMTPQGVLITIIPNLAGLLGKIQRHLDRRIFDLHIPLTKLQLELAHKQAGLSVIHSAFVLGSNWAVLNVGSWPKRWPRTGFERMISWATHLSWSAERLARGRLRPNERVSPYIGVVARFP